MGKISWKDWVGVIGTIVTTIAFIGAIATEQSIYLKVSLAVLLLIIVVLIGVQVVKALRRFNDHVETVSRLSETVARNMSGEALSRPYDMEIAKSDHAIKHLQIDAHYQDAKGHRVTLKKTQTVLPMKDGFVEIWDRNLKVESPGFLDWDSAESTPGKVDITKKRNFGTTFEVPTVFSDPLPINKPTTRVFKIDMIDTFPKDTEDLLCTLERHVETLFITVNACDGLKFVKSHGTARFGGYEKNNPDPAPYITDDGKRICWDIPNGQIGEVYRLVWLVQR
ncbi:MAG: hypothetical protein IPH75_08155 [bacterium]|nr:hypothetical protein [bacterium]